MTEGDGAITLHAAAILFDNDGVLSDSRAATDDCWRQWAVGIGLDPEPVLAVIHGPPARDSIARLAPHLDPDAALADFEQLELAVIDDVGPMPGAAAVTASVPRDRWIVVTSGTEPLARARLARAGIEAPDMVTANDVRRGKPDPEPYLMAARRLGVDPAACVVFDDTSNGVSAGRAAGATVVGVTGTSDADLGAHHHIADLRAVTVALEGDRLRIALQPTVSVR